MGFSGQEYWSGLPFPPPGDLLNPEIESGSLVSPASAGGFFTTELGSHCILKGWVSKNWCFQTVVLEKTLESSSDCKEIKPISPKGNQPWIFIGRIVAEVPILWPHDVKSQLIGKDLDAGKDWGPEEKGATEDEVVGWHHRFNGHEFEQALGDCEGQGSLAGCSPRGCRELDTT